MLLHLVRHGRPVVDSLAPAREWELDPAGIPEIDALRAALPPSAHEATWFSSDERKALATARRLTDSAVTAVPDLREAARSSFVEDQAAFAAAVSRGLLYPAAGSLPGWEPLEHTRERVTGAVAHITRYSSGDVVLVGHGTAWTLLLTDLLSEPWPQRVPPTAMPDLLVIDLSQRTVVSPWGEWRSQYWDINLADGARSVDAESRLSGIGVPQQLGGIVRD